MVSGAIADIVRNKYIRNGFYWGCPNTVSSRGSRGRSHVVQTMFRMDLKMSIGLRPTLLGRWVLQCLFHTVDNMHLTTLTRHVMVGITRSQLIGLHFFKSNFHVGGSISSANTKYERQTFNFNPHQVDHGWPLKTLEQQLASNTGVESFPWGVFLKSPPAFWTGQMALAKHVENKTVWTSTGDRIMMINKNHMSRARKVFHLARS